MEPLAARARRTNRLLLACFVPIAAAFATIAATGPLPEHRGQLQAVLALASAAWAAALLVASRAARPPGTGDTPTVHAAPAPPRPGSSSPPSTGSPAPAGPSGGANVASADRGLSSTAEAVPAASAGPGSQRALFSTCSHAALGTMGSTGSSSTDSTGTSGSSSTDSTSSTDSADSADLADLAVLADSARAAPAAPAESRPEPFAEPASSPSTASTSSSSAEPVSSTPTQPARAEAGQRARAALPAPAAPAPFRLASAVRAHAPSCDPREPSEPREPLDTGEPGEPGEPGLLGAAADPAAWGTAEGERKPRRAGFGCGATGRGAPIGVTPARSRSTLTLVIAGAVLLRLLALAGDPGTSDDVHRYVWEGGLVAEGVSPWAHAPDAEELASFRERWAATFAAMNNRGISAAYPPVAQLANAAAVAVVGGPGAGDGERAVLALRVLYALCDLLVLVPLVVLVRRRGAPDALVLAWGWCPLVALELAGAGHFDSLAILLFVTGLALVASLEHRLAPPAPPSSGGPAEIGDGCGSVTKNVTRNVRKSVASNAARQVTRPGAKPGERKPALRRIDRERGERLSALLGIAAIGAAGLVKLLPFAALPFALRTCWRVAGAGAVGFALVVVAAVGVAPFLVLEGGFAGIGGGLGEYGLRWENASLVHRFVDAAFARTELPLDESWSDPRRLSRLFVGVVWGGVAAWAWARRYDPVRASAVLVGAFVLLSPTLHPWYLAWYAPFLALWPRASWTWLLAAGPLLHWPVTEWQRAGRWVEPAWLWPVLALPFVALGAWELVRGRRA